MQAINQHTSTSRPSQYILSTGMQCASSGEQARLIATLTSAFISDPPVRWIYPEADSYLRAYPQFALAFGGGAFDLGTAWRSEDFSACALWFPPGSGPDEQALVEVIEATVPARRYEAVFAVFEAMGAVHPNEPHWYLPLIGVDAGRQGCGLGSALLREVLQQCDRDGSPAYLESSNPRNIPLYEQHGFRLREAINVGDCPSIVSMWREPQPQ